jgi:hypothetical protein
MAYNMYYVAKTLLGHSPGYILYGDDAGGIFVQNFALFLYHKLPGSHRPDRMIAGVSSFDLFPSYPILMNEYLGDINTTACFTGHIKQLVQYSNPDLYTKAIQEAKTVMSTVTNVNASTSIFYLWSLIGNTFGTPMNANLSNLNNPSIFRDTDYKNQLPYPYGLGNLNHTYDSIMNLIRNYSNTPLTVYMTERDTNVNGGVTKSCVNAPNLVNNQYSVQQGPYRLARTMNFYLTMKKLTADLQLNFRWSYAVCPNVGHNSVSTAHCITLYYGFFNSQSETTTALENPSFAPQYFHFENYPT